LTVIKYIEQTYARSVDSADQSVLFGKLLFDMGECESAIKYFLDALNRLSDNNNQMRATYLNNIGVCYNELGKKDEALKYYRNALKIYERTDNKRGLGACQHNVSNLLRSFLENLLIFFIVDSEYLSCSKESSRSFPLGFRSV
jgi:tetratricopeptide (TPR) repeat protein